MSDVDIRAPRDEAEIEALCRVQADAFGVVYERIAHLMTSAPAEQLRVLVGRGRVLGGLRLVPMGHWLGGRSVPTTGIAAVAVDPLERGGGLALKLMQHVLREGAQAGVALSSLYPAVVPLYRAAGYELAGVRHDIALDLPSLRAGLANPGLLPGDGPGLTVRDGGELPGAQAAAPDTGTSVREGGVEDEPAMQAAYTRFARAHNGLLDRGAYVWRRARSYQDEPLRHLIVEGAEGIEGYCSWRSAPELDGGQMQAHDVVVLTPDAARHVLALFARHASLVRTGIFHGAPQHPLVQLLPSWCARLSLPLPWMLRVTNVPAALEARGYPAGLRLELHLEVRDPLLPGNARRWLLEVGDGLARVSEGGQGLIRLDVRALAALISGHLGPEGLAITGLLAGAPAERARLAAVFAGPAPWMPDIF